VAGSSLLLVDTNLLVLLIVGHVDARQIATFKRSRAYTAEDFLLLADYIARYRQVVTTPNVLTEVSNLVGQWTEPYRTQAFSALAALVAQVDERYVRSATITVDPRFLKLGLTDVSILHASQGSLSVLTDDLPLYSCSAHRKSCERKARGCASSFLSLRPTTFTAAPWRSSFPSTSRKGENFTVSRFSS
jgi:hypothetical protein